MAAELTIVLLSIAVVCIGLALLIGHALTKQILTIAGTVLAGVVLVYALLA